jgi:hypothetical protein
VKQTGFTLNLAVSKQKPNLAIPKLGNSEAKQKELVLF